MKLVLGADEVLGHLCFLGTGKSVLAVFFHVLQVQLDFLDTSVSVLDQEDIHGLYSLNIDKT